MYINLFGLHVLLLGATHGVGRAVATKLAEAGATMAVQYNSKSAEIEDLVYALGNESSSFQADLSDRAMRTSLFDRVVSECGSIDVIIYNVGQYFPSSLTLSDDKWYETWEKTLSVHFEAPTYLYKRAINYWREQKIMGRIIHINMSEPVAADGEEALAYATVKSATEALTRNMSQLVSSEGIRIFTLTLPALQSGAYLRKDKSDLSSPPPSASPKDVAPIVAFLCSGMADYISGTVINLGASQGQLGGMSTN